MDRPFGPWLPDAPDFENLGLAKGSKNAIPLDDEQRSYGPLPSLIAVSSALAGEVVGLTSARDVQGNSSTFAGTRTSLNRLESTDTWTDISRDGGYSLQIQESWNFVVFGNFLIAAGDTGTPVQLYDLEDGTQFEIMSNEAPNARYAAVVRDFLMLGNTFDPVDGSRPDQVWWSSIGNPRVWPSIPSPAASSVQSGKQPLPDSGYVQSIQSGVGGADACIFCEDRIWRCDYEGPPTVFRFDPVERARGAYTPGSVVSVGDIAYYLSHDGFYAFNGSQSTPIGAGRWDKFVLDDLDPVNKNRMTATVFETSKHIVWAYPGSGNVGGRPNKLLIYNYLTGFAMPAEIDVQAIASLQSPGYTLDELDQFGNLDELEASLDSPIWAGGAKYVGVINANGQLSELSGPHLEAEFRSNQFGGERIFVSGVRPYINSSGVTVSLRHKFDFNSITSGTSFVSPGLDRLAPFRVSDRYFAVRVKVAAGSDWPTNGKAQGFDIKFMPEGLR